MHVQELCYFLVIIWCGGLGTIQTNQNKKSTIVQMSASNNETDKIAIVAAACASAIWVYEQVKLPTGINIAMLLCTVFIISGLLYLMAYGLTLSIHNVKSIRFILAKKTQNDLFTFTIKYFCYILTYLLYLLVMGFLDIDFETANGILTFLTLAFGILATASLFRKPQGFMDRTLEKIYHRLSKNN